MGNIGRGGSFQSSGGIYMYAGYPFERASI